MIPGSRAGVLERAPAPEVPPLKSTPSSAEAARPHAYATAGRAPRRDRQTAALRVASHVAVVVPFAYGTIAVLVRGWLPPGDYATIAARSWDVFTRITPLVGQRTALPKTHDLGPLEYWLLSLPVRVDPEHGALWGAALTAVVAAWLSIEAARRAYGIVGCVITSATIVALCCWMPGVVDDPGWNPHLGLMCFFVVLTSACAVYVGRHAWWPVLVLSASIAVQCHLMFAIASVSLVMITGLLAAGRAKRHGSGLGPIVAGVLVGVVCWTAPLVQEVRDRPGNMSLLLSQSHGRNLGLVFGLKSLIATLVPPVVWWRNIQAVRSPVVPRIIEAEPLVGVVAAGVIVLVPFLVGIRLRSQALRALSTVSLVSSVALVLTFADLSNNHQHAAGYMIDIALPVGLTAWISLGWALGLMSRALRSRSLDASARARRLPEGLKMAAGLTVLALLTVGALAEAQSDLRHAYTWPLMPAVIAASNAIEQDVRQGPVHLIVKGTSLEDNYALTVAIAYQLQIAGYHPEVSTFPALPALGPGYAPTPHAMWVVVRIKFSRGVADVRSIESVLGGRSAPLIAEAARRAGSQR
jgi:hypothetical protein